MENSSKAILIAGAILLTMAIIGIGMLIFSQTNTSIENMGNNIDGMAVTAHNNKFNNYIGEISGRQVTECAQKALQINSSEEIDEVFKGITVMLGGEVIVEKGSTSYNIPATFKKNEFYESRATYDNNGIIKEIEIDTEERLVAKDTINKTLGFNVGTPYPASALKNGILSQAVNINNDKTKREVLGGPLVISYPAASGTVEVTDTKPTKTADLPITNKTYKVKKVEYTTSGIVKRVEFELVK